MIQRPTIRERCAWVRSNTWRDERPVETGLDRFFSVFRFFDKHRNWQPKNSEFVQPQLVVCLLQLGLVQFQYFFQSSKLDLWTLILADILTVVCCWTLRGISKQALKSSNSLGFGTTSSAIYQSVTHSYHLHHVAPTVAMFVEKSKNRKKPV